MPLETLTAAEIAQNYKASLDSVNLINTYVAMATADRPEDYADTVKRNVDHLEIMVAKDYWTTEDMKPLTDAITAGKE